MVTKSLFCEILDGKIKPLIRIDNFLAEEMYLAPFDNPTIDDLVDSLISVLAESLEAEHGLSYTAIRVTIVQYLWGGNYDELLNEEERKVLIHKFSDSPKTAEEIYDYFISFHTDNN